MLVFDTAPAQKEEEESIHKRSGTIMKQYPPPHTHVKMPPNASSIKIEKQNRKNRKTIISGSFPPEKKMTPPLHQLFGYGMSKINSPKQHHAKCMDTAPAVANVAV